MNDDEQDGLSFLNNTYLGTDISDVNTIERVKCFSQCLPVLLCFVMRFSKTYLGLSVTSLSIYRSPLLDMAFPYRMPCWSWAASFHGLPVTLKMSLVHQEVDLPTLRHWFRGHHWTLIPQRLSVIFGLSIATSTSKFWGLGWWSSFFYLF